ncbi:hypothetical protein [Rhizobium sp.]
MQKKKQGQSLEHPAYLLAGDSPFISPSADFGLPADRKVINGGSRHEKLNGTRQSDTINGKGDNDVIDGNGGDLLQLFEQGAANATWQDIASSRQLDGTAGGDYAFISLIENGSGRVLAALAVDQDIIIELL